MAFATILSLCLRDSRLVQSTGTSVGVFTRRPRSTPSAPSACPAHTQHARTWPPRSPCSCRPDAWSCVRPPARRLAPLDTHCLERRGRRSPCPGPPRPLRPSCTVTHSWTTRWPLGLRAPRPRPPPAPLIPLSPSPPLPRFCQAGASLPGRRAVPAVCSARAALSSWVRCPSSATRERERGSEFSARRGTGPHPPSPGLQGSAPGFGGRAGTACGRLSAARQPVRPASPPPREACGRLGVPESRVLRPPSVPAFVVRSQAARAPLRSPGARRRGDEVSAF